MTEHDTRPWRQILEGIGAYWHHDGNLNRPFARLTSGKISDTFIDCSRLIERPDVVNMAIEDLANLVPTGPRSAAKAVCGSAMGAVTLSHAMASYLGINAWFTEPNEDKTKMLLKRFNPSSAINVVLPIEDVLTTGGTTDKTIDELEQKGAHVLNTVCAIVNRSGRKELRGRSIVALLDINDAKVWDEGQNPYTGGGERVAPVRPKQHWNELIREYA